MKKIRFIAAAVFVSVLAAVLAYAAEPPEDLERRTSLGLYLSAEEAYAMWQKGQGTISILDVRTPEEYVFLGHAPMAADIPLLLMGHDFDAGQKKYPMRPNPGFMEQVKARFSPEETILVMCRSGQRSAPAVNKMATAGYTRVYSIVDGFEGDPITAKGDPHFGQRMRDGWRNRNLPWTYDLDPALVYTGK